MKQLLDELRYTVHISVEVNHGGVRDEQVRPFIISQRISPPMTWGTRADPACLHNRYIQHL